MLSPCIDIYSRINWSRTERCLQQNCEFIYHGAKKNYVSLYFQDFQSEPTTLTKLIISEYPFSFLHNALEFLLSYEVLMYVIRDRNNVPIDLYFLCFTSPTLSLFLMMKREKKNQFIFLSKDGWIQRRKILISWQMTWQQNKPKHNFTLVYNKYVFLLMHGCQN